MVPMVIGVTKWHQLFQLFRTHQTDIREKLEALKWYKYLIVAVGLGWVQRQQDSDAVKSFPPQWDQGDCCNAQYG